MESVKPRPRIKEKRSLAERARGLYLLIHLRRRRVATGLASVVSVMLAYQVIFGHNGLTAFEQKRRDAHDLELQVRSLQQENDLLRGHADRLQSDPGAIEHQAREELHYTRPGEVIYTLPPDKPADKAKLEPKR